jgi:transposase
LSATLSYLSARCRCSRRVVEELVETVFGLPLSLGTVIRHEAEMAEALKPAHEEIGAAVRAAGALNVDESGWFQKGKLCWMWVAAAIDVVLLKIAPSRSRDQMHEILGAEPPGVIGSDRCGVYGQLPLERRQLCWSHLGRDFQALVDYGGGAEKLGQSGLHAAAALFVEWKEFKRGRISRTELQARLKPVEEGLRMDLLAAVSGHPSKAAGLACRLLYVYSALWTFTIVEGVEPTNNHAERQLRRSVQWRKVSFGSHSSDGSRFVERTLSIIQTLILRKRPILDFLTAVLSTHRQGLSPPPVLV